MLPIPFISFIPKLFQKDGKAISLGSFMDTFLSERRAEVLKLRRAYRYDEVDSYFLPEIAFLLGITFRNSDSDVIKRKKIKNALPSFRYDGCWNLGPYSIKLQLDGITGYSAVLMTAQQRQGEWVLVSSDMTLTEPYVASLGAGTDPGLGLDLTGMGDELSIRGNIYIDLHSGVHTAVLTNDMVNLIKDLMINELGPVYLRLFLGYVDADGKFISYVIF